MHLNAAKRLQKWWRNRLLRKKRGFAPLGVYELIKMFEKVKKIQNWYRGILEEREKNLIFKQKTKCVMLVQKFAKIMLAKRHKRKLINM